MKLVYLCSYILIELYLVFIWFFPFLLLFFPIISFDLPFLIPFYEFPFLVLIIHFIRHWGLMLPTFHVLIVFFYPIKVFVSLLPWFHLINLLYCLLICQFKLHIWLLLSLILLVFQGIHFKYDYFHWLVFPI